LIGAADIGGTKIVIASFSGVRIVPNTLKTIETPKDPKKMIEVLGEELKALEPEEISIATMGPMKLSKGMIINNPHLEIKNFELGRPLLQRLGVPVYMINDCVAGAWAEARVRGEENLVYVGFGTGVGVGAIVDGHLLLGKDGNAHEFGHVTLSWSSELPCGCGGKGHVESFLGGSNIPNFLKLLGISVSSTSEAFEIFKRNEVAFNTFKNVLLSFLSSVVNAYDPEVLVLGGGVYFKNVEIFERVLKDFPRWRDLIAEPPRAEPARFNDLAPLYGAAYLALDKPEGWIRKLRYLLTDEFTPSSTS